MKKKARYFSKLRFDKMFYQDDDGNILKYTGPTDYDVQKAAKCCWMDWCEKATAYDMNRNVWCYSREKHPDDPVWVRRFSVIDSDYEKTLADYKFCFLSYLVEEV
jgi:hypothetical protein